MTVVRWLPFVFTALVIHGCSSPPPSRSVPPPRKEAAAPSPEQSAAVQRADALIAEMHAREAAQQNATPSTANGELWWKNQIRTHQSRFQEHKQHAEELLTQMSGASGSEVDRLEKEAKSALAAAAHENAELERLFEQARREKVPDIWLRWP